MTKTHEKLLIGILAGLIVAGAAAFAVQPALAGKLSPAPTLATSSYDVLSLRLATPN